jgi:DUF4097 and DUF4098 domain-containing protein YvlB
MPAGRQPEGENIMTSWEFAAAGPIATDIELPSGSVIVTARPTSTAHVELHSSGHGGERLLAETEVSFEGETLRVHVPKRSSIRGHASLDLSVEVPEGSSVKFELASADVRLDGPFGPVRGTTASGDVNVDRVSGDVDLTVASGDVKVEAATEDIRVSSASGDVRVGQAGGDIITKTASGDVWVNQAGRSVTAKTASGDVRVDSIAAGLADATTVSGDVMIAVVPGTGVYMDISTLTGDVSSDLEADDAGAEGEAALTVTCRTVSGDIRLRRASAA